MTDPRTTPDPSMIDRDDPAQVIVPIADLNRSPSGPRDRQLLLGDRVQVLGVSGEWSLIRSEKDGYCGWVCNQSLGNLENITHRITARATHTYTSANFKSPETQALSFGSHVCAIAETATFIETEFGFIPRQHVHTADSFAEDPSAVAEIFLGTPYLWGGNSSFGIDCSGLVQAACLACNIACEGDTDQQQNTLGTELPLGTQVKRNDVVFWKGHVALVFDENLIIHANAGHMSTVFEPLDKALERIETQGDGRPTAFRRLT